MPKIIHAEVRQRICQDLDSLTSDKVKEVVTGLTKHSELIASLFSKYAIPSNYLRITLRQEILDFFIHVQHPEDADPQKNAEKTLPVLFYSFRNKIGHEYRILHSIGVDLSVTTSKVSIINELTEALIGEAVTNFRG